MQNLYRPGIGYKLTYTYTVPILYLYCTYTMGIGACTNTYTSIGTTLVVLLNSFPGGGERGRDIGNYGINLNSLQGFNSSLMISQQTVYFIYMFAFYYGTVIFESLDQEVNSSLLL